MEKDPRDASVEFTGRMNGFRYMHRSACPPCGGFTVEEIFFYQDLRDISRLVKLEPEVASDLPSPSHGTTTRGHRRENNMKQNLTVLHR